MGCPIAHWQPGETFGERARGRLAKTLAATSRAHSARTMQIPADWLRQRRATQSASIAQASSSASTRAEDKGARAKAELLVFYRLFCSAFLRQLPGGEFANSPPHGSLESGDSSNASNTSERASKCLSLLFSSQKGPKRVQNRPTLLASFRTASSAR